MEKQTQDEADLLLVLARLLEGLGGRLSHYDNNDRAIDAAFYGVARCMRRLTQLTGRSVEEIATEHGLHPRSRSGRGRALLVLEAVEVTAPAAI